MRALASTPLTPLRCGIQKQQQLPFSDGDILHPQLAQHGPGHEDLESNLASAQLQRDWAENIDLAEHTVPRTSDAFINPEHAKRRKRIESLGHIAASAPVGTVWALPELVEFLTVDRFAAWLMNYLVLQPGFQIDDGQPHREDVQSALETGLS